MYSYKNQPTELFHLTKGGKVNASAITQSTTPAFEAYDWYAPEVVSFMSVDAIYDVYARVYKPEETRRMEQE